MKQSITRVLFLLLALALAVGLLPMAVLAGGDSAPIGDASVFVTYPVAGAHPNPVGVASYDDEPYTVDRVNYFEVDAEGHPVGKFLDESYTFVANQKYACQVILLAKENYYFYDSLNCDVNSLYGDVSVLPDGTAVVTVFFLCAPGTVTVTFDANGSEDPAPAPIQVPIGATVWDAIRNFDEVRMADRPWESFYDWSLDPFATDYGAFYPFSNPVTQDLTLYAMWIPCERSVELWVELPDDCMVNDVYNPAVTVPANAGYQIKETDNFFVGLVDGYLHPDLVYTMPLEKGVTYYSRAIVWVPLAAQLPDVTLHGAKLISVRPCEDWGVEVIFSVTPETGDSLEEADVYINTPRAGQNAISYHPDVKCLTPGVHAGVQGWFESSDLGMETYDGTLEGGKTYYALVYVGDDTGSYALSYGSLQLNVEGTNVQLIRMIDLSADMPNYVGAVVAVTIPKEYIFTADVPYGGGKIRSSRENQKWVTTMDFSGVPEGSITVEAKADATHVFRSWYDATTYETLSTDASYTFMVDRDVHIRASFASKPPFEDVDQWDYFYEPVMWAVNHDPVITRGVGDGLFGVGSPCTRAQIMTFLWKANDAPDPITTESPFSDVKPGDYYYKAVLWAVENHITRGVGDGRFGANDPCTREQAMTFLWKSKGSPEPQSMENPFTDVDAGSYYCKAVLWASQQTPPITAGMGGGLFGVGVTCAREQIITFLYKVYGPKG